MALFDFLPNGGHCSLHAETVFGGNTFDDGGGDDHDGAGYSDLDLYWNIEEEEKGYKSTKEIGLSENQKSGGLSL